MTITEKVNASKAASLLFELAAEEAENQQDTLHFWQTLKGFIEDRLPAPPASPSPVPVCKAMNATQRRAFEKTPMPFGLHRDRPIRDVPMEYLQWVASLDFTDKVRAYLADHPELVEDDLSDVDWEDDWDLGDAS